jgi:hypothetical protein
MTMKRSLSLVLLFMLALAGCAMPADLGGIDVALVTTGSDGAIYRVQSFAVLQIESSTYSDGIFLDGDEPIAHLELAAGTYSAHLLRDEPFLPLTRQLGSAPPEDILATVVTPMPMQIVVAPGATTSVQLQLRTAEGETLTFDDESAIDVSIAVDHGTPSGFVLQSDATLACTISIVDTASGAPAELTPRMPAVGASVFGQLRVAVTGPFAPANSSAICAPASIQLAQVEPESGLDDLLREASAVGSSARVCVDGEYVSVRLERRGTPATATFSDLGASEMVFRATWYTTLPQPAYANETLDLGVFVTRQFRDVNLIVEADAVTGGVDTVWHVAEYRTSNGAFTIGATY